MADASQYTAARTASTLNLVAGAWLVIAPWALGYSTSAAATWNSMVVGALIVVFAGVRVALPGRNTGFSWLIAILGAWLVLAPWILQYGNLVEDAAWNETLSGIANVVLAIGSAMSAKKVNAR